MVGLEVLMEQTNCPICTKALKPQSTKAMFWDFINLKDVYYHIKCFKDIKTYQQSKGE